MEKWRRVRGALETDERNALAALEIARAKAGQMVSAAMQRYRDANNKRLKAEQERDQVVAPNDMNLRLSASPKIRDFAERLEERRRRLDPHLKEFAIGQDDVERCVKSSNESCQAIAACILKIQREDIPELELAGAH